MEAIFAGLLATALIGAVRARYERTSLVASIRATLPFIAVVVAGAIGATWFDENVFGGRSVVGIAGLITALAITAWYANRRLKGIRRPSR